MTSLERLVNVQQVLVTRTGPGLVSSADGSPRPVATEAGNAQGQAGFERRVAWLEEDVAVLHRRLRDECNEGGSVAGGDSGLRALVARLDGELSAERRSREAMEARIVSLEDSIRHERKERETQLRAFSSELETTMRGLIGRIDEGLSAGAAAMQERTDQTEDRLRGLIIRVDEGLSAGAAALQDTLVSTGAFEQMAQMQADANQAASRQARQVPNRNPVENELSEQVLQSYDHLRQEQQRYSEQQRQLNGQRGFPPSQGALSAASSTPQTVQVAGSGLQPRLGGQQAMSSGYVQRTPLSGMSSAGSTPGNRR